MKIAIIGGGPAGLYFANYLKQQSSRFDVTVFEAQNASMNAFGLGYTLQKLDTILLSRLDPDFYRQLFKHSTPPKITQALFKTNYDQRIMPFSEGFSVTRVQLLSYLRAMALSRGVNCLDQKIVETDLAGLKQQYDLVVAADGINSLARKCYSKPLQARAHKAKLKFSWFMNDSVQARTEACFYAFNSAEGVTMLTSYPLTAHRQVVVIEMTDQCLASRALKGKTPSEAIPYLNRLLRENDDQINLQSTDLPWYTFKMNTVGKVSHENLALIGDAAYSFHYSAGQGVTTSFSMAYTLGKCLQMKQSLPLALAQYNQAISLLLLDPAKKSLKHMNWFENIDGLFNEHASSDWLDLLIQKDEFTRKTPHPLKTRAC